MIIDCHVHHLAASGYAEKLIRETDKLGIERICLLAGKNHLKFWGSRMASNEEVLEAWRLFPERIIPFGFVELGIDSPGIVDTLFTLGFRGLKITRPRKNYNDDEVLEVYARAAAYELPILLHTGTVFRTEDDEYFDVDSSRMRPIFLDRIARKFPRLNLIGAHLGNPWYEEAAMVMFWNPNVYFDLSGSILKRKDAAWFNETLWWTPQRMAKLAQSETTHYTSAGNHPFSRICFGSDVPIEEMAQVVEEYRSILEALELPAELRERVMGGNLRDLLKLA